MLHYFLFQLYYTKLQCQVILSLLALGIADLWNAHKMQKNRAAWNIFPNYNRVLLLDVHIKLICVFQNISSPYTNPDEPKLS